MDAFQKALKKFDNICYLWSSEWSLYRASTRNLFLSKAL